jgi:hypothetical protein
MVTKERRPPHPTSCLLPRCVHAIQYGTIIDGVETLNGQCSRPSSHGQFPDGCSKHVQVALKHPRRRIE